jgi:ADP-ribosylglycohydrolase
MKSPSLPPDHATRIERAAIALDGLSLGDALGETCFRDENFEAILEDPRATAKGPWPWTDDTAMALGIYEVLHELGRIDQDALARRFASRYRAAPWRGYGAGAHRLLAQIVGGIPWGAAAGVLFGGGSFGNGSAMRIAPLAGYFAEDDYAVVAEQARLSAQVTHAHPEGIAGCIAAAVAGAYAWKRRDGRADAATKRGLFDAVLEHTPPGEVREGIERAASIQFDTSVIPDVRILDHGMSTVRLDVTLVPIVRALGNGSRITCQDTVPFCLWVAGRHLDGYEAAIITTIRAGGDVDTNCAIVGGIVALAVGREGIPRDWLADREQLVV